MSVVALLGPPRNHQLDRNEREGEREREKERERVRVCVCCTAARHVSCLIICYFISRDFQTTRDDRSEVKH